MADPGARIAVESLTKSFGTVRAVDSLSFSVEPGSVTGFLGPNGAGKTTTLRMLLGLAVADSGTATIGGHRYADIPDPGRAVGAVLEATSFHPGRSGRNHLRVYCAAMGLPPSRADEVLELVGLAQAGRFRVGGYSMGMRQRLGLATAMLGDPRVLILDEPANGLDPEGIAWLRGMLRHLATAEGRTVLVSSHILSEVEQTVDRVVIIARGRLVHEGTLGELRRGDGTVVTVRSPHADTLRTALQGRGSVTVAADGALTISGISAADIGHAAFEAGVELHELRTDQSSLEEVFLELTGDVAPTAERTS
jgi:ABC-2 type transport system ATP-binding protein